MPLGGEVAAHLKVLSGFIDGYKIGNVESDGDVYRDLATGRMLPEINLGFCLRSITRIRRARSLRC